nr:hypothetical protein CFP56_13280 [Quercus suber]
MGNEAHLCHCLTVFELAEQRCIGGLPLPSRNALVKFEAAYKSLASVQVRLPECRLPTRVRSQVRSKEGHAQLQGTFIFISAGNSDEPTIIDQSLTTRWD